MRAKSKINEETLCPCNTLLQPLLTRDSHPTFQLQIQSLPQTLACNAHKTSRILHDYKCSFRSSRYGALWLSMKTRV